MILLLHNWPYTVWHFYQTVGKNSLGYNIMWADDKFCIFENSCWKLSKFILVVKGGTIV